MQKEFQINLPLECADEIDKIISKLDPKREIDIIFSDCSIHSMWMGVEPSGKIRPIVVQTQLMEKNRVLHHLIHEISHILVYKSYESRHDYEEFFDKFGYLLEYKVEKTVRKFCKKENLIDALRGSNQWCEFNIKNEGRLLGFHGANGSEWTGYLTLPYIYASKRIMREEKECFC